MLTAFLALIEKLPYLYRCGQLVAVQAVAPRDVVAKVPAFRFSKVVALSQVSIAEVPEAVWLSLEVSAKVVSVKVKFNSIMGAKVRVVTLSITTVKLPATPASTGLSSARAKIVVCPVSIPTRNAEFVEVGFGVAPV